MAIQDEIMLELLNNAGTGDFTAAEAGVSVQMNKSPFLPHKKAIVWFGGSIAGTMKISSSPDDSTWTDLAIAVNGGAGTTTAVFPFMAAVSLGEYMRAECTAFTSGVGIVRLLAMP